MALSRAKAWLPVLDQADISTGYPSLKEDGTPFEEKDFAACMKEIRPLASLIANETHLTKYQLAYDLENQKMPMPAYKVTNLILPICRAGHDTQLKPLGMDSP